MIKLLFCLLAALGAVAQVTVTGPLNTGIVSGTDTGLFAGKVVIERAAVTNGGIYYAGYRRELTITAGALSVSLVPNVGSVPSGTSYKVTYYPSSGFGTNGSYVRNWIIPATGPTTVAAVETSVAPVPSWSVAASQITGVLPLANGGTSQTTWTASRCVQVNSAGTALESAAAACGSGGGGGGTADPGANGIVVRTGSGTAAARTLTAGSGQITITNGDGVAGNPTVNIGTLTANTSGNAATATALAANPANCSSGQYPKGVDASGAAEGCAVIPAADLPAVVVETNQSNTYSTGDQDFSAATAFRLPTAALGTTAGRVRYDATSGLMEWYDAVGGASRAALFLPSGTGFVRSNGTNVSASSIVANDLPSTVGFVIHCSSTGGVAASTTAYFCQPGLGVQTASDNNRRAVMPVAGTVTAVVCAALGTQSGTGANVLTLQKNTVDTSLTGTLAAGSSSNVTFTGSSVSYAAGDWVSIKGVNAATAPAVILSCSIFVKGS